MEKEVFTIKESAFIVRSGVIDHLHHFAPRQWIPGSGMAIYARSQDGKLFLNVGNVIENNEMERILSERIGGKRSNYILDKKAIVLPPPSTQYGRNPLSGQRVPDQLVDPSLLAEKWGFGNIYGIWLEIPECIIQERRIPL